MIWFKKCTCTMEQSDTAKVRHASALSLNEKRKTTTEKMQRWRCATSKLTRYEATQRFSYHWKSLVVNTNIVLCCTRGISPSTAEIQCFRLCHWWNLDKEWKRHFLDFNSLCCFWFSSCHGMHKIRNKTSIWNSISTFAGKIAFSAKMKYIYFQFRKGQTNGTSVVRLFRSWNLHSIQSRNRIYFSFLSVPRVKLFCACLRFHVRIFFLSIDLAHKTRHVLVDTNGKKRIQFSVGFDFISCRYTVFRQHILFVITNVTFLLAVDTFFFIHTLLAEIRRKEKERRKLDWLDGCAHKQNQKRNSNSTCKYAVLCSFV